MVGIILFFLLVLRTSDRTIAKDEAFKRERKAKEISEQDNIHIP